MILIREFFETMNGSVSFERKNKKSDCMYTISLLRHGQMILVLRKTSVHKIAISKPE